MPNETTALSGKRVAFWITPLVAVLAWAAINALHYSQIQNKVLSYGQQQLTEALHVHSAIHRFVEEDQKPVIYGLQNSGHISADWFEPKVLSGTYVARRVQEEINAERHKRGEPAIEFRLAAINARNPSNEANEFEASLIRRINEGLSDGVQEIQNHEAGSHFYAAVPIFRHEARCTRCHGKPEDAPGGLIGLYGDKHGFGKTPGEIGGLISVKVPVQQQFDEIRSSAIGFATRSALVTFLFALVVMMLLHRIHQQTDRLEVMSRTDALTSLANRRHFDERIEMFSLLDDRYEKPFSLVLIDIDFFKSVNDRFGHDVGDSTLKELAACLETNSRRSDVIARWGGEEFIILLPETELKDAADYAEKLRRAIKHIQISGDEFLSASFGVVERSKGETKTELLRRADQALYGAKEAGRDRVNLDSESLAAV